MAQEEILQKLQSKSLFQVLEAYVQTWKLANLPEESKTPLISVYLNQGSVIGGEIIDIDFEEGLFSLRLLENTAHLNVTFLNLNQVQAFTLLGLEECVFFVDQLAKV